MKSFISIGKFSFECIFFRFPASYPYCFTILIINYSGLISASSSVSTHMLAPHLFYLNFIHDNVSPYLGLTHVQRKWFRYVCSECSNSVTLKLNVYAYRQCMLNFLNIFNKILPMNISVLVRAKFSKVHCASVKIRDYFNSNSQISS